MIPCNCDTCKKEDEPTFYEFSDLITRRDKGKSTVECKKSYDDVPVLPLLEGFDRGHRKAERRAEATSKRESVQTVRIFLASSSELKEDRDAFEIFISRENDDYIEKGIYLMLIRWENFLDAMSQTRLQNEYNKAIEGCDVFVSLYHSKAGKYTEEEFLTAYETFKAKGKPQVFTYLKDEAIKPSQMKRDDFLNLDDFKQKLNALGHYPTIYADINDLKYQFSKQLTKLLPTLAGT